MVKKLNYLNVCNSFINIYTYIYIYIYIYIHIYIYIYIYIYDKRFVKFIIKEW